MNVIERMESMGAAEKIASFIVKQKQPYEFKVKYAEIRAREFETQAFKMGFDTHISVGGLDSMTLLLFLRSIGIYPTAISASYLEDKSIQRIHKQLGVTPLHPTKKADGTSWSKAKVIQEFGFPVLSKETAGKIEMLQHPTSKNETVRHAILTGETGAYGGNRTGTRMQLSAKWLKLFRDPANIPFLVSSKCCYYLKEKPCDDWGKQNNSVPYLGLMASEGGRRAKSLMINGCNYFGKSVIRSAPFAIFNRQDILQLALDLKTPVPEIYGEILRLNDGTLITTKAQRTGCDVCGFGIHLEPRPHRFDRIYDSNPKQWQYLMYDMCTDAEGEKYGWARVLDYIGIPYLPQLRLD